MSDKCLDCGSADTECENGYKVCTNCGHVYESDVQLADDPLQALVVTNDRLFSGQKLVNALRNELDTPLMSSVKRMGVQMAETLALNFCFNSEMKNYLMNYYNKALNHKNFFNCSYKKKKILASVCAYVTFMNHNESIAIQYMCSAVGCSGHEFNQIYSLFVKTYPEVKPEGKPIEELVPSVLADFNINEHELKELKERVVHIISIEKACWLVDGRSPLHVIIAATYLAWKSLRPHQRAIIDFPEFCKTFGINQKKTSTNRIKEFNDVFIKLAKHIPAVRLTKKTINRNNIAFFIDDIIQYPNSLIYDLKREVNLKFGQKENNCEDSDEKWMKCFKRKTNHKNYESKEQTSDCETRSQDISDTEIDGYLRNENEIKIIKKLRKRAKRMAEECKQ